MANEIDLVTANRVRIVESNRQMTLTAAEAITAGMAVRIDTTDGTFTKAKGTDADEARAWGVAAKTVVAGMPVTAIRNGVMDGWDLDDMDYDDPVYLSDTDGRLSTVVGTVTLALGRVIPAESHLIGGSPDKLLSLEL